VRCSEPESSNFGNPSRKTRANDSRVKKGLVYSNVTATYIEFVYHTAIKAPYAAPVFPSPSNSKTRVGSWACQQTRQST